MNCIKCDGRIIPERAAAPGSQGFRCDSCDGGFLDLGRIGGEGQSLKLADHGYRMTAYRCPVDREHLRRYLINGLEFEYCDACRHVWLDKEEAAAMVRKAAPEGPRGNEASGWDSLDAGAQAVQAFFELIGAIGDW